MSVPVFHSTSLRNSIDTTTMQPSPLRVSDITSIPLLPQNRSQDKTHREITLVTPPDQKTEKKLLSTFASLQAKLTEARQQLSGKRLEDLC
jgi:hypothetical protein